MRSYLSVMLSPTASALSKAFKFKLLGLRALGCAASESKLRMYCPPPPPLCGGGAEPGQSLQHFFCRSKRCQSAGTCSSAWAHGLDHELEAQSESLALDWEGAPSCTITDLQMAVLGLD